MSLSTLIMLLSLGFFQNNVATRIQENSNTLINQIWSNNLEESKKSKSGILINDISDHKMIFTFIENIAFIAKFDKLIKIKQKSKMFQKLTLQYRTVKFLIITGS